MRRCKSCGVEKPLEDFATYSAGGKRGRRCQCQDCWRRRWRETYLRHATRYYRTNANGYRDKAIARQQGYYHGGYIDPQKAAARAAVQSAVRAGRLRQQPCVICGAPKSQAHHEDYSKPLEVTWLCSRHHGERHRKQSAGRLPGRGVELDGQVWHEFPVVRQAVTS